MTELEKLSKMLGIALTKKAIEKPQQNTQQNKDSDKNTALLKTLHENIMKDAREKFEKKLLQNAAVCIKAAVAVREVIKTEDEESVLMRLAKKGVQHTPVFELVPQLFKELYTARNFEDFEAVATIMWWSADHPLPLPNGILCVPMTVFSPSEQEYLDKVSKAIEQLDVKTAVTKTTKYEDIEGCWIELKKCHSTEELKKVIKEIPSRFGEWEIGEDEYGVFVTNSWFDRCLNSYQENSVSIDFDDYSYDDDSDDDYDGEEDTYIEIFGSKIRYDDSKQLFTAEKDGSKKDLDLETAEEFYLSLLLAAIMHQQ